MKATAGSFTDQSMLWKLSKHSRQWFNLYQSIISSSGVAVGTVVVWIGAHDLSTPGAVRLLSPEVLTWYTDFARRVAA